MTTTKIRAAAAADETPGPATPAGEARLRQLSLSAEQRTAMLRMVEGIVGDAERARRLVEESLAEMASSSGGGSRVEAFGVYAAFAQVRRRALRQRAADEPPAAAATHAKPSPPAPPIASPPAVAEPTPPEAAEPTPPEAAGPVAPVEPDRTEGPPVPIPSPPRRRPGSVAPPPPLPEPAEEPVMAYPALPLRRSSAGRAAQPAPVARGLPWRQASEPSPRLPPETAEPPEVFEPRPRPRAPERPPLPARERPSPPPRPEPRAGRRPVSVPREAPPEEEPPALAIAELPPRPDGRLSSAWLAASRGRRLRRLVMVLAAVIIASEVGLLGLILAERVQRSGAEAATGESGAATAPAADKVDRVAVPPPLLDRRPAPEPLASAGPRPLSLNEASPEAAGEPEVPDLPLAAPRAALDAATEATATRVVEPPVPAPGLVAPTASDADGARADTALTPPAAARVVIHHTAARAVDAMLANKLAQRLEGQGFKVADIRAVRAHMPGGTVRYYFPQDRELGRVLLANLGQILDDDGGTAERLQDYSHYRPKPEAGTIDVWLPTS